MRPFRTQSLLLVFAQIVAAASAGCASNDSSPHGAADAGDDGGLVNCGPCGCGGGSSWTVTLDGGLDTASEAGLDCLTLCVRPTTEALTNDCVLTDAAAPATVTCYQDCTGRRPEGLRRGAPSSLCEVGAYFAALAQLEAASVPAFRRMAGELARFGAPERFVGAARRAAREEIRHARAARSLARRHGAERATFDADGRAARSLEAFAIENAIEGCVRETYGALVATWQAERAEDARVRAHFARIARDETRHAALAHGVDRWARARLDRAARARVDAAVETARAELRDSLHRDVPTRKLARAAGLPPTEVALALASMLDARLAAA